MSVVSKMITTRLDGVKPVDVQCATMLTDERPSMRSASPYKNQYMMELRVRCKFWSEPEHLKSSEHEALKICNSIIYRDVLELLPALRFSVYNGDRREAMELIRKLEEAVSL